jgi:hypothetical protein
MIIDWSFPCFGDETTLQQFLLDDCTAQAIIAPIVNLFVSLVYCG